MAPCRSCFGVGGNILVFAYFFTDFYFFNAKLLFYLALGPVLNILPFFQMALGKCPEAKNILHERQKYFFALAVAPRDNRPHQFFFRQFVDIIVFFFTLIIFPRLPQFAVNRSQDSVHEFAGRIAAEAFCEFNRFVYCYFRRNLFSLCLIFMLPQVLIPPVLFLCFFFLFW